MIDQCSFRRKVGVIIYDLPRFIWAMRPEASGNSVRWILMRNRDEKLILDERRIGVCCDWKWTSNLHIAGVYPSLGLRLMQRALRERPIEMRSEPPRRTGRVSVTFIIGHRGTIRLPLLLTTLQTIAAQREVSLECIVVEQSSEPEIIKLLPSWVRYIHTPLPRPDMPYCRSWAFNVAARLAKGDLLVFHDNDMLLPRDYATQLLARFREGYEVINLKRFIFYLNESHSRKILSSGRLLFDQAPETVVQNLEAGGSLAVDKEAFIAIGGFDEQFVGWGGEDNEFWDRARTLAVWPYGYMPLVHLWHAPQAEKSVVDRPTASLMELRLAISASQRISELSKRDFGGTRQTDPPYRRFDSNQQ